MSTDSEDRMTSGISSELLRKMKILLLLREVDKKMKQLELLWTIFFGVRSIGNLWDVWQHLAGNWHNCQSTDTWLVSIGNAWLAHSVVSTWTLNKGKQMGFRFKQPLVGEKRCVTTQITAAEETKAIQIYICYLPAGRSVSWKTVTEVLKMLPEAAGQGQHF